MPKVTPFRAIRPNREVSDKFCALPYDVYNRQEAKKIVDNNPLSFLAIDRAETSFDESVGTYDDIVYEKASKLLEERLNDGTLLQDEGPCFYVYELTMDGRSQSGIVGCSSVDDYLNSVIRKHENTREDKEIDRIRHVDTTNAHTGPIFLIYRHQDELKKIVADAKNDTPVYDFVSDDGIRHRAFVIDDREKTDRITKIFEEIPCTYIADGHHRCASAVKVALKRRKEEGREGINDNRTKGYDRFLSVIFPDDELKIMAYNRVVKDLNGYDKDGFISAIKNAGFTVDDMGDKENDDFVRGNDGSVSPAEKGAFSMLLDGKWYLLHATDAIKSTDPVKGLDVSILQDNLLSPILGIDDPRTDKRIDFVGGIRGNRELVRRCNEDMKVAFAMYPTSIEELLSVADAGLLMPPKSTWFEPKLRSGMFIHSLDD